VNNRLHRLESVIRDIGPLAVAVSGGVDSMTLAFTAHRVLGDNARMLHAVSPAVPEDASNRVRHYARQEGWRLDLIDAREFADANYIANPHDRCFYCKTNLYATMSEAVDCVLVSGTNSDDLGDYRPGLKAATAYGVVHPYVEAGMDKAAVRAVARALSLDDLASLPASPCLSSRVETGLPIKPKVLDAIYFAERLVRRELKPKTARCRVRRAAVVIELDDESIRVLGTAKANALRQQISVLLSTAGIPHPVSFQTYLMGSAFLRPDHGR
jgi:uncharacterized protein